MKNFRTDCKAVKKDGTKYKVTVNELQLHELDLGINPKGKIEIEGTLYECDFQHVTYYNHTSSDYILIRNKTAIRILGGAKKHEVKLKGVHMNEALKGAYENAYKKYGIERESSAWDTNVL